MSAVGQDLLHTFPLLQSKVADEVGYCWFVNLIVDWVDVVNGVALGSTLALQMDGAPMDSDGH